MSKVYFGLDKFEKLSNAIVTSGTFDGVHDGHKVIFNRLNSIAKESNGESVVLTFWPHPRLVLNPQNTHVLLLSTLEEKIDLLKKEGIEHIVVLPFTKSFSQLSSKEFIDKILIESIGTKKLVIGYDHKFGKNQEGSFEYLSQNTELFPFDVEEIPKHELEDIAISSSEIREALKHGEVSKAQRLLGSAYTISGKVVMGEQVGRKIGFPTANILVEEQFKLIPTDGVYAVGVEVDGQPYSGMLNIGNRPTLNGTSKSIEVNIFELNQDLYGQQITLEFFEMIRKEKKFASLKELQEQLVKDKIEVEKLFVK
jgi:riboflavin kinase / FMN adenylyltransferase